MVAFLITEANCLGAKGERELGLSGRGGVERPDIEELPSDSEWEIRFSDALCAAVRMNPVFTPSRVTHSFFLTPLHRGALKL